MQFDIIRPTTDEVGQRRVALNQATLRRLNEAMRGGGDELVSFRCECGRFGCNQLIRLSPSEYAAVRAHPRRFVVVPGHEVVEIESAVERHNRYAVVEAHAAAVVGIAEQTSPRRDRGGQRPAPAAE